MDGAVYQEDGVVRAVGAFADLKARHPEVPILGSNRHVLLPGLVNAHHHVGLTPLQLGSPDMPLELWWITRMACRGVDPYLDTLYGAFEMIASGVTTVQHLHGWVPGGARAVEAAGDEVIRAYADAGMRAARPARLEPPRLHGRRRLRSGPTRAPARTDAPALRIVANLHWCSDDALEWLAATSKRLDVPLHMHLVETAYQRAYAERRSGGTALAHIDRFDLLGPRLTLGHGVWLSPEDVGRVAETGTHICHNCSSNLRLRSGIAPLDDWTKRGINVAIGMDEAGINDDRDMLQELRFGLIGLAESLAAEFAPLARVNAVCPGNVDTPMLAKVARDIAVYQNVPEDAVRHGLEHAGAARRLVRPREVAEACLALCRPGLSAVAGASVSVDAGAGVG